MTFTSDEIADCFAADSSRWEQLALAYAPRELELYTWTSAKLIELSSRPTMASRRVGPEALAAKNRARVAKHYHLTVGMCGLWFDKKRGRWRGERAFGHGTNRVRFRTKWFRTAYAAGVALRALNASLDQPKEEAA